MRERRFSQAISEGDGISVIVDVGDPEAARAATAQGAEALAVRGDVGDLRAVTELPILWRAPGSPSEAALAGAHAWLVAVEDLSEEVDEGAGDVGRILIGLALRRGGRLGL